MARKNHRYTKEQIGYLRKLGDTKTNEEITKLFNRKFNVNLERSKIAAAKTRNKIPSKRVNKNTFKKGMTPWNKGLVYMPRNGGTRFQKGHDINKRKIGEERIDAKDNYIHVKVANPSSWMPKHRYLWEQENGPIPDNHVVIFGNGDNRNFDIDNLICVSRKQLLGLNRHNLIQNDAELTKVAVNIVDLEYKMSELSKGD